MLILLMVLTNQRDNMRRKHRQKRFTIGSYQAIFYMDYIGKLQIFSFLCRFSVDSKLNIIKRFYSDANDVPGAAHADDLCYVFWYSHCFQLKNFY